MTTGPQVPPAADLPTPPGFPTDLDLVDLGDPIIAARFEQRLSEAFGAETGPDRDARKHLDREPFFTIDDLALLHDVAAAFAVVTLFKTPDHMRNAGADKPTMDAAANAIRSAVAGIPDLPGLQSKLLALILRMDEGNSAGLFEAPF